MVAKTATTERQRLEAQLAENERTVAGQVAKGEALKAALAQAIAAEEKEKSKQVHVERINALLDQAKELLREAGEIAADNNIDFTFESPRGDMEFNNRWMSSDCYGEHRWYEQGRPSIY